LLPKTKLVAKRKKEKKIRNEVCVILLT